MAGLGWWWPGCSQPWGQQGTSRTGDIQGTSHAGDTPHRAHWGWAGARQGARAPGPWLHSCGAVSLLFFRRCSNPATNKRKNPACHRNPPGRRQRSPGLRRRLLAQGRGLLCSALLGGLQTRLCPAGAAWAPNTLQAGPCAPSPAPSQSRPVPIPSRPRRHMIRCCCKSSCTGRGCLKPLCPDDAEESERFGARGAPAPRHQEASRGERGTEGAPAPHLGARPRPGQPRGAWAPRPAPARQREHCGHPDPLSPCPGARGGSLHPCSPSSWPGIAFPLPDWTRCGSELASSPKLPHFLPAPGGCSEPRVPKPLLQPEGTARGWEHPRG